MSTEVAASPQSCGAALQTTPTAVRQSSARLQPVTPPQVSSSVSRIKSAQPVQRKLDFEERQRLRNHPDILPHYYGQRFAGRKLESTFANDAWETHFVGPNGPFNTPAHKGWASNLNAQIKESFEGIYGPKYAGVRGASSIGGDGSQMTVTDGPTRFKQAEWRHQKEMRRAGRPSSSCTCVRSPMVETGTGECLNPRIGTRQYPRGKKSVSDPRNGISFRHLGDKVYDKPENQAGFHTKFVDSLFLRKYEEKVQARPVSAPTHLMLHNRGIRRLEKLKRKEDIELVKSLEEWKPAEKPPEPEPEEEPKPKRGGSADKKAKDTRKGSANKSKKK